AASSAPCAAAARRTTARISRRRRRASSSKASPCAGSSRRAAPKTGGAWRRFTALCCARGCCRRSAASRRRERAGVKALPFLAAGLGVAAGAALVVYFGADAVWRSLSAVGWAGFAAVCAIHLALIAAMGAAWWVLLPGTRAGVLVWARLVRDSGSEVLPLSQVGGYVLGARAATLGGVSATASTASTIVDVSLEFVAQLAYTALGLFWLVHLRPGSA